jgi:signal transduction histidine kinase
MGAAGPAGGLVLLASLTLCMDSSAQTAPPVTVLTIHSGAENFPSNPLLDAGIRDALDSRVDLRIDDFSEYLEDDLFPGAEASLAFKDYIHRKYVGRHIDIVIAITATAMQFALNHRAELFPDAPIVFEATQPPDQITRQAGPGATGVVVGAAYPETLKLALELQPSIEQVFVIAQATNQRNVSTVRAGLRGFSSRVRFTYIEDTSLPGLLAAVRGAAPNSIVLFIWFSLLEPGRVIYPDEIARLVAKAAPVPVYGSSDLYIGSGLVGGVVRDTRETGTRLGHLALQILTGTRAENIPIEVPPLRPVLDWRQMKRWGIDVSRLPPRSDVRYQPPTLWESYRRYVVGAVVVISAELLLIGALLTERASRRRAENIVRARESALRASYDRIRQLNARVINAQETARAAIARELHDDVCQELVSVLLELSNLKRSSGHVLGPGALEQLSQLHDTTSSVVEDIRRMSHDLHPATLRLIGLAAAVRAHCIEVERRNDVQVAFESEGELSSVHLDIALCLFRVVQEALRNAAAHGDARRMAVAIRRLENVVALTVTDDGRGFDVDAARQSSGGLGLVSMEERVRLLSGTIEIVSGPTQGTTIIVHIPADARIETPAVDHVPLLETVLADSR